MDRSKHFLKHSRHLCGETKQRESGFGPVGLQGHSARTEAVVMMTTGGR